MLVVETYEAVRMTGNEEECLIRVWVDRVPEASQTLSLPYHWYRYFGLTTSGPIYLTLVTFAHNYACFVLIDTTRAGTC